jgi:hypothetical protein
MADDDADPLEEIVTETVARAHTKRKPDAVFYFAAHQSAPIIVKMTSSRFLMTALSRIMLIRLTHLITSQR